MPTIIVDKAKGLFQKAATSQNPAGSFSGAKSVVYPSVIEGVAALTASLGDSGKSFILGGAGGNTTLALPEMTAANIGWNCELIVTGALEASAVIQTVDTDGASATSDTFLLSVGAIDAAAETDKVTTTSNTLTFVNGGADADDACVVEVRYIAVNKAIAKGNALT
jgi:hypothetical protein